MEEKMIQGLMQLWSHVHDVSVTALASAVLMLGLVVLLELRSVVQLRHVTDKHLGRVFEQLDLLRFETQRLLEGQQSLQPAQRETLATLLTAAATPGPMRAAGPASAPGEPPAARPAAASERHAMSSGEARLLSSLAEARARRAAEPARA